MSRGLLFLRRSVVCMTVAHSNNEATGRNDWHACFALMLYTVVSVGLVEPYHSCRYALFDRDCLRALSSHAFIVFSQSLPFSVRASLPCVTSCVNTTTFATPSAEGWKK